MTIVQLDIGTPIDRAVEDVRSALQQVRGIVARRHPRAAGRARQHHRQRPRQLCRDHQRHDDRGTELVHRQYGDQGTAVGLAAWRRSTATAASSREIRVKLDPAKLQSLGLTASQVNAQLRQVNLNASGGRAEIAGSEQSVRVLGNAADAYALSQTQIAVGGGRTIKLSDIATVQDQFAEQRSASQLDGRQVITFDFQRAKGASDVSVFHGAEKKLAELEKKNPKVKFKLIFNETEYAEKQYHSAIEAMVEGAVLAVVVVFLFLRDWRATAISALAIPLSAIPTFLIMQLLGFTLNQMTLARAQPGRGRAGRRCDRRDREYRPTHAHGQVRLSGVDRRRRRDRPRGARHDDGDRRGVPAGRPDARRVGPVLQEFRPDRRRLGADEPGRRAADHADDRGLFPQGQGPRQPRRRPVDGRLYGRAALDAAASLVVDRRGRGGAGADRHVLRDPAAIVPARPGPGRVDRVDRNGPRHHARRNAGGGRQGRRHPAQAAAGRGRLCRAFVGSGRVTAIFKKDKDKKSVKFERDLAPTLAAIPDARVSFRSQQGWGSSGRDITDRAGRRRSQTAQRHRAKDRRADVQAEKRDRAAHPGRPATARTGDPAALRPRRRSGRDHRGAVERDPPRDAGRYRPEQGEVLAVATARCRSPSRSNNRRGRGWRRSRTCRCRPRAADRCRCRPSPKSGSARARRRSSASSCSVS